MAACARPLEDRLPLHDGGFLTSRGLPNRGLGRGWDLAMCDARPLVRTLWPQ